MQKSTRPSNEPAKRFAARWAESAALAALLALGACAPPRALPPLAPSVPRTEPAVDVGLAVDTDQVVLSAPNGVALYDADDDALARLEGPAPVVLSTGSDGRLSYRQGDGQAVPLSVATVTARALGDGYLEIAGHPYRGTALVRATGPGHVTAVNQVDMESYLLGVVPRELGPVGDTLVEAAKAQAVAARTYAVKYLGRRAEQGFDVYATTQDQVYGGVAAESPTTSRAVRETAGEILTYQGEPIEAYYSSTCAGRTSDISQVWNHAPVPYLISIKDVNPKTGQAYDVRSSRFHWTVTWTSDELERILSKTLADSLPAGVHSIGELKGMEILERTTSGRVKAMRIRTTTADFIVGGDHIRWILLTPKGPPLNSSLFDVDVEHGANGEVTQVTAEGGGWGHGIGMCQWGAMGRAMAGQDYRTILSAYFPGTNLRKLY